MITRMGKGLRTLPGMSDRLHPGPGGSPATVEASAGGSAGRTPEQIRRHYAIEKELASRLRNAPRQERRVLYSSLYDELYRRVPDHPQLTRKISAEEKARLVERQMQFLSSFLTADTTFLEVGAGDCAVALAVAGHVKQVYAVDVSDEITRGLTPPANFALCLSDGCSIPVPVGTIDIAYSNSLMEHLHPDDALEQLANIHKALGPSGIYICRTPNRLNGPHDVSKDFDSVATGFHLREYTVAELKRLFRDVGFSKVKLALATRGRYLRSSVEFTILLEKALAAMGYPSVQPKALRRIVRPFIEIRIIGIK